MTSPRFSSGAQAPSPSATQGAVTAQLRILATTDVHMQITGFDYVTDKGKARRGLAAVGTLIEQARAAAQNEGRACLLVDNGDLLQGTPMADHLAQSPVTPDHPVVASVNHLRYDAMGLGNHDLDFGLPYLRQVAQHIDAPVISSNLEGDDLTPLTKSAIVSCALPSGDGAIRVGFISVLPGLTAVWNHHWLQGTVEVSDALECLRTAVPALRRDGADVIVVLAHMGIADAGEDPHDTALELAKIPGVDAIIAGHTHRRFPGSDHRQGTDIDTAQGRLCQVPSVMPGHGGSDLGIMDLTLARGGDGKWDVIGHVSKLVEATAQTHPMPAIMAAVAPTHTRLRDYLSGVMGDTDAHLHNYFTLAAPTPSGAFASYAKALRVQQAVAGTQDATLPLISSASGHTAGGRDGPDHFVSIPQGQVLRRHLAALNPYNNQVWAVRISGSELHRWLEHAVSVYATLSEDRPGVPLLNPQTPAFNFETIYGVTYTIDPTQPAGNRIGHLCHDGVPVRQGQMFLLATNQFRVAGGGGFDALTADRIAVRLPGNTEQMLADALAGPMKPLWETNTPWRFATPTPIETEIRTAPDAMHVLDDIAHLEPFNAGLSEDGFLRVQLTL